MTDISLQVTYIRGQPLAAYIDLGSRSGRKSARTQELSEGVLVDFADDNTPLGIEIVFPRRVTDDEIYRAFDHIGVSRPDPAELAPLRAA